MSELAQPLPPQEVIDQHETSRILSDAELIKMGAEIVGRVLTPTAEQIEELAKEGPIESAGGATNLDDRTEPVEAGADPEASEQDKTQEKIDEWLDTMPITVHTWVKRDPGIPRDHIIGSGSLGNSFLTLATQRKFFKANSLMEKLKTPPAIGAELVSRGVSEAVTFGSVPGGAKFGEFSIDSPMAQEEAVQVLYETVKTFGGKSVRTGNVIRLRMMLPKSEADQLQAMLEEQPDIMRELLEKLITEKFQAQEAWENSRPPYEVWKEDSGGVSKIAIRDGLRVSAEDSKILEF